MHVTRIAFVVLALASAGCGRHRHRSDGASSSSGDEETSYRGTVTVENRSQLSVCSISTMEAERHSTDTVVELPPGGSATFESGGDVYRIQFSECGTHRLLYGDPLAWINEQETVPGTQLHASRIVLLDPESAPIEEAGAVSIALVPHDVNDALRHAFIATLMQQVDDGRPFMSDEALAAELLQMLQRGAAAQGWHEHFEAAVVAVPEWTDVRQQQGASVVTVARDLQFVAAARWPHGACTVQSFGARQPYDGYSPQGVVGFNGIGDQLVIPCSLLEEMASYPYVATGG